MSLPEFGVLLGLYTGEEIGTDLYRLARHEDFDDVIASWWPQISDSPWCGVLGADVEASKTARYRPERVGRTTLSAMCIVADIRGVGFRFCLE
ncbi:hypothetical protein R6Q57_029352 [Mikania cordata]